MDDESLYRRVLQGDRAALSDLVRRYHASLYRFLCRYTGDPALADDLAQDTFTRLLTYRGAAPVRFRPWAYAIATNLARDYFRSARHRYEFATDFEDAVLTEEIEFPSDTRQQVVTALQRLSLAHREVLILRFYHDLSLDEIAEATGTAVGTVKSRLFHALKGLKGVLSLMEMADDRS